MGRSKEGEADRNEPDGARNPRDAESVRAHGPEKGGVGCLKGRSHLSPATGCQDPHYRQNDEAGYHEYPLYHVAIGDRFEASDGRVVENDRSADQNSELIGRP